MSERTPAQEFADLLSALAGHLRENPHLATPDVYGLGKLQVGTRPDNPSTLVDWFRSLGVRDLRVDLFDGYAAVHAVDVLIGSSVARDVWGAVEGLEKLLVHGGGYWKLPLTITELEHYAQHGTLPEAGERR